jgi:hypothetical protein
MSIVTLKRKTLAQNYHITNPALRSPDGFSLNGTHRSQGYIGQTSLSRSLPRTPMKGNVAKGHGGCCGQYYQGNIIQSAVTSLEDIGAVKKSSINTRGLIDTKYRWIRRPQPFTTVNNITRINTQNEYIRYISQKVLKNTTTPGSPCYDEVDPDTLPDSFYQKCTTLTKSQISDLCPRSKIVKTEKYTGAITGDAYILKLHKKCVFDDEFKFQVKTTRSPFTCSNSNSVV